MPCPNNNCNGFILSESNTCEICEKRVCKDCGVSMLKGHICKDNDIESHQEILNMSKRCPNESCRHLIVKSEGCDQMTCTSCYTPFYWSTGKIVTAERIHNPYYIEMMKNKKVVLSKEIENIILNPEEMMHQFRLLDIENQFLPLIILKYANLLNILENTAEQDTISLNSDLRLKYLIGDLSELKYKQLLGIREYNVHVNRYINNVIGSRIDKIAEITRRMFKTFTDLLKYLIDDKHNAILKTFQCDILAKTLGAYLFELSKHQIMYFIKNSGNKDLRFMSNVNEAYNRAQNLDLFDLNAKEFDLDDITYDEDPKQTILNIKEAVKTAEDKLNEALDDKNRAIFASARDIISMTSEFLEDATSLFELYVEIILEMKKIMKINPKYTNMSMFESIYMDMNSILFTQHEFELTLDIYDEPKTKTKAVKEFIRPAKSGFIVDEDSD